MNDENSRNVAAPHAAASVLRAKLDRTDMERADLEMSPRIEVTRTGGVSHVTKDGQFYGDYLKAEHAAEAANTARGTKVKAD